MALMLAACIIAFADLPRGAAFIATAAAGLFGAMANPLAPKSWRIMYGVLFAVTGIIAFAAGKALGPVNGMALVLPMGLAMFAGLFTTLAFVPPRENAAQVDA
jgi:hypothetical protein